MKQDTVNLCIFGLSTPMCIESTYSSELTDQENILVLLSLATSITTRKMNEPPKPLFEAVFELKDGKKVFGYSDKDEPSINCGFYHLAATKELKGRVAVLASDVRSFRFTPL